MDNIDKSSICSEKIYWTLSYMLRNSWPRRIKLSSFIIECDNLYEKKHKCTKYHGDTNKREMSSAELCRESNHKDTSDVYLTEVY